MCEREVDSVCRSHREPNNRDLDVFIDDVFLNIRGCERMREIKIGEILPSDGDSEQTFLAVGDAAWHP